MRKVVPGLSSRMHIAALLIAAGISVATNVAVAQNGSAAAVAQGQFPPQSPMAQEMKQNLKEVFFPFNVYSRVIPASVDVLKQNEDWLKQRSDAKLWLQGYADIRGDIFYNLVLSYRRAQFVKKQLVAAGINESQIQFATGWGKLYPVCQGSDEECYQQQRRVDIVPPDSM
jgi:outer membrane protein OmpA-like peptidoglycan-associated protein